MQEGLGIPQQRCLYPILSMPLHDPIHPVGPSETALRSRPVSCAGLVPTSPQNQLRSPFQGIFWRTPMQVFLQNQHGHGLQRASGFEAPAASRPNISRHGRVPSQSQHWPPGAAPLGLEVEPGLPCCPLTRAQSPQQLHACCWQAYPWVHSRCQEKDSGHRPGHARCSGGTHTAPLAPCQKTSIGSV